MKDEIFLNELNLPPEERWENLTLANDFLFGKVFQDLELCLELVQIILPGLNIKKITFPVIQKSVKETLDSRGVRFDIYLYDDENRIINIEIQSVNRDNLRKRVRVYHSLIDLDVLNSERIKKYNDIPESIVIFICDFDLFKLKRHIYTFKNICVQERGLMLNDGTSTIFLSTKGKINDVSERLKNFLNFIGGKSSDDLFVKKLEEKMKEAKQNSKLRRQYMLSKFDRNELIDQGFERGIAIGEARGRNEAFKAAASFLEESGISPEFIAKFKASMLN